ncbi:hypothetical protein ACRRTK_015391 [Alexandromys fortis]
MAVVGLRPCRRTAPWSQAQHCSLVRATGSTAAGWVFLNSSHFRNDRNSPQTVRDSERGERKRERGSLRGISYFC